MSNTDQNSQQTEQTPVTQPDQISGKPRVNYWMISTFILMFLFLGALGWYIFFSYNINRFDSNLTPTQATPTSGSDCQTGECQFPTIPTSREICEIGREYENTSVSPVECQCPEGYEFETLSTGWGSCPQPGMGDCPSSILKCVEAENFPSFTQQDLEKGWYWGSEDQKKPGTPKDWIFSEAGRSSCWHMPGVSCL